MTDKKKTEENEDSGTQEVERSVMHPLPQTAIDKFDEYSAALSARDEVMKSIFKFQYKKAVYFGKIAEQSRRKFWEMVKEIYPELGEQLSFDRDKGTVSILEKGA